MLQMPLDNFLSILSSADVNSHPYTELEDATARLEMGIAFTAFAHSFAGFVNAGRIHLGYEQTRDSAIKMSSMLQPVSLNDDGILGALLAAYARGEIEGLFPACGECDACLEADAEAAEGEDDHG